MIEGHKLVRCCSIARTRSNSGIQCHIFVHITAPIFLSADTRISPMTSRLCILRV